MNAQHVNAFLEAASHILGMYRFTLTIGKPAVRQTPCTGFEVLTVIGVSGQLRGQVYLGYTKEDALCIVSNMMGGVVVADLDSMAQSAIAEIGNMICGTATIQLSQHGMAVDITPPAVIMGNSVEVARSEKSLIAIPIQMEGLDGMELCLALEG
ncbi:hypothetical protein GE107_14900 [Cohnella sp. CFH 77786]|uniref:chemotaxis protein CheX n=1 Tax=Cohnella sp. CFH 77786 TaxID=2662265 RepID=UPI001C60B313|nr:chemotaxis protein CheX [Cohnella sp. CFH 77786]MBW5447343.1 hypothetical protein [Cohnella sp. CFH 77786]